MEARIARLRAYARDRVEQNHARIVANLHRHGVPLVLDVAPPGAGYFFVAAGGLAEVLHLLGDDCVKVDRFIGVSGGACSLFLILANQPQDSVVAAVTGDVGRGGARARCPGRGVA